jgi:hypothetical protein
MFRQYASSIPGGANDLFLLHPAVLSTLLELTWKIRWNDPQLTLGDPGHRSDLPQLPDFWLDPLITDAQILPPTGANPIPGTTLAIAATKPRTVFYEHLIYAYMIENTRIVEIFRRVMQEFFFGEKLGVPTPAAQQWLRNTEELFFRDPPPFAINNLTSRLRPEPAGVRRNAYWRMFGMDLNHGAEDGKPYNYFKADAYNNEFVTTFEEFLREAWVAISNIGNTSGANPTDRSKLVNLVQTLQNMLMARRINGNLAREEFVAVTTLSWFHLTVQDNFPIIETLRAEASSPEQRLFKIAQRVGMPAHGLSKSYFDLADPISRILILIEAGGLNNMPTSPASPFTANVQDDLNTIITHWSVITGHEMKAGKVAVR